MNITSEQLKEIIKEFIKEVSKESISKKDKVTLTIAECANLTGIGREKITELVYKNEIPHFKVGSKTLINKDLLFQWLNEISVKGVAL